MWTFVQASGWLLRDGKRVARGYAGWDDGDGKPEPGEGKNDPRMERVRNVGPVPAGRYRIVGPPVDRSDRGPYVLRLEPEPGTQTYGRGGFLIHGDSIRRPGTASHGCIILPRHVRECVWLSADHELNVAHNDPVEVA